jgi:hypothetical protein
MDEHAVKARILASVGNVLKEVADVLAHHKTSRAIEQSSDPQSNSSGRADRRW